MYDEILHLDLDEMPDHACFIIFPNGRTVPAIEGHSRTAIMNSKRFRPAWYQKIKAEVFDGVDLSKYSEEELLSILNNTMLGNHRLTDDGFVVIYNVINEKNDDFELAVFGNPKTTKKQKYAIKKLSERYKLTCTVKL